MATSTRFLNLARRLAIVLCGYVAAALAASATMHVLLLGSLDWGPGEAPVVLAASVISVPYIAIIIGYFALLPAIGAILLGETLGVRSRIFHSAGGVAVSLCLLAQFRFSIFPMPGLLGVEAPTSEQVKQMDAAFTLAILGSGIAAGAVYGWLAERWSKTSP